MDSPELGIEKRTLEMHAQTACAARRVLFELIRRFDDLRCGVQHRFERSGHDARDETGRSHAGVLLRGNDDGVALIAIEEGIARAVGVNVDQAGSDIATARQCVVGWSVGR